VLFAQPQLRDFIAANFIPAWESVRDVPTLTIDFGGGRVLKRTYNGNVAAYVCAPDGRVLDILPGLSTPEAYLRDLRAALALARRSPEDVLAYHASRPAGVEPERPRLDMAKKMGVEPRIKRAAIAPGDRALLEADAESNRRVRKPKIHALLAERSWTSKELTKRVYRDILDCDLDDPYLGLGQAAFDGGAYGRP
jgi:hypothetical protein